jgi:hypothetical protein
MKKFSILFAAVAMIAMTACNEKVAKNDESATNAPATEQVDTTKATPKVDVDKAKPTEDGKDHVVAEFENKDYQVRLENLADGTYRVTMWKAGQDKSGKPDRIAETKKCVMKDGNYLMQTEDGTNYIIKTQKGAEQIMIMNKDKIIYPAQ